MRRSAEGKQVDPRRWPSWWAAREGVQFILACHPQGDGKERLFTSAIGAGWIHHKTGDQVIVALNIAAVGEALRSGIKAGFDPRTIYEASGAGWRVVRVLDAKAPMTWRSRLFRPGFKLKLHHKDLTNALAAGRDRRAAPLSSLVQQILVSLINEGKGEDDHSAIATFFEKVAHVEIKSRQG